MASVTLADNQWKRLRSYPRGAAAGGSVVIDVTSGDLTVTWYPQPNASGSAQGSQKCGEAGQQK